MAIKKSDPSDVFTESDQGIYIDISVTPNSSNSEIGEVDPWRGNLKVAVKEKATDGNANEAVIGLLADRLGLSKKRVNIVKGSKKRQKRLFLSDVSVEEIEALLRKGKEEEICD